MSLEKIANELVAGVREGRAKANLDKLYAKDAVSVEAMDMGSGREAKGLDAIKGKHEWWENAMEMLGGEVEGPFPFPPDRFAVYYTMKTRNKETGEVGEGKEVGVYHVKDDKIVREELYYGGPGG